MTEEKVTSRIAGMKERMLNREVELLPERAILATEAFDENAGLPVILQRAMVFKRIVEESTLFLDDEELFAGSPSAQPRSPVPCPEMGAGWIAGSLDGFSSRGGDPVLVSEENKAILREYLAKWKNRSLDSVAAPIVQELAGGSIKNALITVGATGTSQGNISINYKKLLSKGVHGIIDEIDEKIKNFSPRGIEDAKKLTFWRACKIACEAVIDFAHRYAALARERADEAPSEERRAELERMADDLAQVPEHPARTFRQALQSVWLIYTALHMESDPFAILLGRMDQYLHPYYKADKAAGRITDEEVVDLLGCLWIKCTSFVKLMDENTTKTFAGYPMFQTITLGGQDAYGEDASNELSPLFLRAAEIARTPQPNIVLRYHNKISEELLHAACRAIKIGMGYPSIMNDGSIVPKHLARGASLEEARNYCANCVETDVEGMTDSRATSGYINLPKCLLLAMNDGVDLDSGEQIGLHTGRLADYKSFDQLLGASKKQISAAVESIVRAYDMVDLIHAEYAPEPFLSSFVDDCVERGVSRQDGGVRYNYSGIFGVGLATLADSLMAIKSACFENRKIDAERLVEVLKKDFAGADEERRLLAKAPKFGNDDDTVDALARDCASYFCAEVRKHRSMRGGAKDGFYLPELHSVSTHVYFGECTGATPDGRHAGLSFSDGASPSGGADTNGPTASVRSVTKIDHVAALQGVLFNQKFAPQLLDGDEGTARLADYIRTFCDLGGHHIQFNLVSTATMREAQDRPREHRDLIVRVAGYSAYFTELNRNTQDEIIARTEYSEYE